MSARFLHTADWQLGKPFAGVEDAEKRVQLQLERVAAIDRVGKAAREHGAEFVVVAGDLFDSPGVTSSIVSAACAAIGKIGLPVFAIAGNHDHGGPGSVWEQPFFLREKNELAPNLHILLRPEPVELETAILFPCPLLRRHEATDTTAWLRSVEPAGDKPRIVLAHGSVQGFTTEDEEGGAVNRLEIARLPAHFDYIALGDWHGAKQVGPKAWYSGTPELDRFPRGEGNEPGYVLAVTARRGGAPEVERVRTARLGWHELAFDFAADASLEALDAAVDACLGGRAGQDLLQLELRGSLGLAAMARLEERIESWQARVLRLKLVNAVRMEPSESEIAALTQRAADPLIARVAAQLVERTRRDDESAAVARVALRELHAACQCA